jgi:hypothetical protein
MMAITLMIGSNQQCQLVLLQMLDRTRMLLLLMLLLMLLLLLILLLLPQASCLPRLQGTVFA